jgi:Protein of unknown function (DUF3617)
MKARLFAAAFVVCGMAAASAQNFPKMKSGMWESVTKTDQAGGRPIPPSLMCIDESVVEQMMKLGQGMAQGMCSKAESSISGNKLTGNVECKIANSTIRSTSVTTFNGDTSYRTETKSTYDPPLFGSKEASTVVEAKYVGPCKAGMKPGDISANGVTMNVLSASRGAPAPKK